jgi:glycosyltransferase involved in cell wall biosynthesis
MHLLVFSEPFPNLNHPGGGKFIESQVQALSEHMDVTVIVPLRFIPPREVFINKNPGGIIKAFKKWYNGIMHTRSYKTANLDVYYFRYVSLIRPYFPFLNVYIMKFVLLYRINKVIKKKPVDAVYLNWVTPGIMLCEKIARQNNVPLLIDNHANHSSSRLYSKRKGLFNRLFYHFAQADRIIVHSTLTERVLLEEFNKLQVKPPEIEKIYLGQNFTISDPVMINPEGRVNVVTVSHLVDPGKNIDGLIHAMYYLKKNYTSRDFHLDIIGDGIMRPQLEELTKSLQLSDHITFHGHKSVAELDRELGKYDIFVFPSYVDTFGLVAIEAIAKGLPVIACKGIGVSEELITMGDCICLVKPSSSIALAEGIIKTIENPEKSQEMVKIGQKIVAEHFTWQQNAVKTYNTIVASITEHKNLRN